MTSFGGFLFLLLLEMKILPKRIGEIKHLYPVSKTFFSAARASPYFVHFVHAEGVGQANIHFMTTPTLSGQLSDTM